MGAEGVRLMETTQRMPGTDTPYEGRIGRRRDAIDDAMELLAILRRNEAIYAVAMNPYRASLIEGPQWRWNELSKVKQDASADLAIRQWNQMAGREGVSK